MGNLLGKSTRPRFIVFSFIFFPSFHNLKLCVGSLFPAFLSLPARLPLWHGCQGVFKMCDVQSSLGQQNSRALQLVWYIRLLSVFTQI